MVSVVSLFSKTLISLFCHGHSFFEGYKTTVDASGSLIPWCLVLCMAKEPVPKWDNTGVNSMNWIKYTLSYQQFNEFLVSTIK